MKPQDELPSLEKLEGEIGRLRRKATPVPDRAPRSTAPATQMGVELIAGVLLGTWGGVMLDRWLGTAPWLLIVCFLLGTAGGAFNMYRAATAMDKNDTPRDGADEEKKDEGKK